jgi:predicted Zn-dependent protease
MLARAQAALDASRAGAAGAQPALRSSTETLQTWVAEHPGDATAWTMLAQGADLLGLKLRALRAEAEAQAAVGDLGGAIDRLRAAQRLSRAAAGAPDFIEASIIDARLRDLTARRRAQLAEARGGDKGGGPRDERTPTP